MSEWRPIETAPKDDLVLVAWKVRMTDVGAWWEFEIERADSIDYATHWMPLPEPPE